MDVKFLLPFTFFILDSFLLLPLFVFFQFVVFLSSHLSWRFFFFMFSASCSRNKGPGCRYTWSLMGTYSVENKRRCTLSNTHCCPSYFVLWEKKKEQSWIVMYHGFAKYRAGKTESPLMYPLVTTVNNFSATEINPLTLECCMCVCLFSCCLIFALSFASLLRLRNADESMALIYFTRSSFFYSLKYHFKVAEWRYIVFEHCDTCTLLEAGL